MPVSFMINSLPVILVVNMYVLNTTSNSNEIQTILVGSNGTNVDA
jgi:hypothetical protein